MAERDLDVVVFGATGVTGRRVAAYLAERAAETGASWAAAARDTAKLDRMLDEDGVSAPQTIVADLDDQASLAAMASRARVVLNLVGPYTLYGRPVIEACVAGGAHYADLTGEIPFVREVIDEFADRATQAGIKLVQVCGFESLPSDLAVLLAAETARDRWGEGLTEADLEASVKAPPGLPRPSDMISGGTAQSLAAAANSEDASAVTDPAALITDPAAAEEVRRRSPISVMPRRSGDAVIAPMMPAAFINPAVIQRTAALLAAESGDAGRAVPLPRGSRASGSGSVASAALRDGGRALGNSGRPRARRRRGSVGEAPRVGRPQRDPSLLRVRARRGSPRWLELAHVGHSTHRRRARGAGRSRCRRPPRDTWRPPGCWARPGCCSPSATRHQSGQGA